MAWTQVGGGAYTDGGVGAAGLEQLFNAYGGESGYNMTLPQYMALYGYADLSQPPVTAPSAGLPVTQQASAIGAAAPSADDTVRRAAGTADIATPAAGAPQVSAPSAEQQAAELEAAKAWVEQQARAGGTFNLQHGYGVDADTANYMYDLWEGNPYRLADRPSEQVFNQDQQFGRGVNTTVAGVPVQIMAALDEIAGDAWKDYFDQQYASYDGTEGKSAYSRALDDTVARYAPELSGAAQSFGGFADKMAEASKPIKTPLSTVALMAASLPLAAFAGPALSAALGGGMFGGIGAGALLGGAKAALGGGNIGMGALTGGLSPAIGGMLGGGFDGAFDVGSIADAGDAYLGSAMTGNYNDMLGATADAADLYTGGAMTATGADYEDALLGRAMTDPTWGVNPVGELDLERLLDDGSLLDRASEGLPQALGDAAAAAAPAAPTPEVAPATEAAPVAAPKLADLAKYASLAQKVMSLLGGEGDRPADAPTQDEDETDEQYAQEVADYAVKYLGLSSEEMAAAGLEPGTQAYYQYIMDQADSIIEQLGVDPAFLDGATVEQLQSALAGKTQEELTQLTRALFVRGQIGTSMGAGNYFDPFGGEIEEVQGPGMFDPATAAYQRGLARSTDVLGNLRGEEARSYLDQLLGRKPDLYGMQASADARRIQALLAETQGEELKRRGLGDMLGRAGQEWAGAIEALDPRTMDLLLREVGGDEDRSKAALRNLFGWE